MRLVSRYIAGRVFKSIALAFLIVTAIIMLVDFVEATRNFGDEGEFTLLQLAGLTLLKIPLLIEETIPFVVLFGVMGALYGLNKRSELVVLRASGLSAWRFIGPAIMVSAAIGIIWTAVFNPLAAKSMEKYQGIIIKAAQTDGAADNIISARASELAEEVWLREGSPTQQVVIHGNLYPRDPRTLHDVTFYYYALEDNEAGQSAVTTRYSHRIDALTASLTETGYWQLSGVVKNSEDSAFERALSSSIPTQLTVSDLSEYDKKTRKAQFWALPEQITASQNAGFSTIGLRLQWHKLLSLPLMLIALTVIAAGVSMGNMRSGGVFRLMLAGAATGFFVFFFNNLFGAFGQAQTLSIIAASWTVPILVLFLGVAYLARIEDG